MGSGATLRREPWTLPPVMTSADEPLLVDILFWLEIMSDSALVPLTESTVPPETATAPAGSVLSPEPTPT